MFATLPGNLTSYQTDHAWDNPSMIYAMSAVDNSGNESFLSDFVDNQTRILADFTAGSIVGSAPMMIEFSDISTGDITNWSWDFGDGATSEEQNPIHTYVNNGTYMVKLIVSGAEGTDLEIKPNYIAVSCVGDFGPDGDVDGSDLVRLIESGGIGIHDFAENFGRSNCF